MRIIDLFCGEGGAAMGYHRAGHDIVLGIDIDDQPNYPFPFHQGDWSDVLDLLDDADMIHASPPCQRYSTATASSGDPGRHPDLIDEVRRALAHLPLVIENVPRAPVRRDLMLCGSMFGMRVRRHRVFELHHLKPIPQPRCRHAEQGRTVDVTGNAGGRNQTDRPGYPIKWCDVDHAREVMDMPWASGRGCTEAIPPAYTEHIGRHLLDP